jgi:glycosyltransferase involved in cell wall biosynthesis
MVELRDERLVVVGGLPPEPDLDRARQLARRLDVLDRVEFRGYVPPTQLAEERRAADVFVIPTLDSETARYFSSPLKLFEAMAAHRPIVASDLPSLREVLTDGVNALLVPPGDAHALALAIRRLAGNRELRSRLAHRAGEDVRRFSWDERGKRITELLDQTCRRAA